METEKLKNGKAIKMKTATEWVLLKFWKVQYKCWVFRHALKTGNEEVEVMF